MGIHADRRPPAPPALPTGITTPCKCGELCLCWGRINFEEERIIVPAGQKFHPRVDRETIGLTGRIWEWVKGFWVVEYRYFDMDQYGIVTKMDKWDQHVWPLWVKTSVAIGKSPLRLILTGLAMLAAVLALFVPFIPFPTSLARYLQQPSTILPFITTPAGVPIPNASHRQALRLFGKHLLIALFLYTTLCVAPTVIHGLAIFDNNISWFLWEAVFDGCCHSYLIEPRAAGSAASEGRRPGRLERWLGCSGREDERVYRTSWKPEVVWLEAEGKGVLRVRGGYLDKGYGRKFCD